MPAKTFAAGGALLVAMVILGTADYVLKEQPHMQQVIAEQQGGSSPGTQNGTSSSARRLVKKGVSRKREANIDEVIATLGLTKQETKDLSFLKVTAPIAETVNVAVLMKNNDRAALIAWIESPDVKDIFGALKAQLQQSFSPQLSGLTDETRTVENGPVINMLSFVDPALSPERIVFLRVRTRLYEIHIAPGAEQDMERLVAELNK